VASSIVCAVDDSPHADAAARLTADLVGVVNSAAILVRAARTSPKTSR
jgi:hypothetical protein